MFGIGMTEMMVIAIIALIFIGPDQIPEVARTVGRLLNDIRRSTDDLKRDFQEKSGLPRDLNDWVAQPRRIAPREPVEPTDPAHESADPYEGLDAESLGHVQDAVHASVEAQPGPIQPEPAQLELGEAVMAAPASDDEDPKKS